MLLALFLLAQNDQPAAPPGLLSGLNWMTIILVVLVFYMLMIRPAQRQEKERKAMIAQLKKNDRVIAAGGIIGTVYAFKEGDEEVTLKVDEGRIRILRSSIMRVFRDEETKAETKADAKS